MSDADELVVLKQLYNFKNPDPITDIPFSYPLLEPGFVKNIAKSVTEIVYNSNEQRTLSAQKSADTILELLKKWTVSNTHLPVTASDVDTVMNHLSTKLGTENHNVQIYSPFFLVSSTEKSDADDLKSICATIRKKYEANLENKLKSGLLQVWDGAQLRRKGFEFTFLVKNMQNSNIENFIEYLQSLDETPNTILNEKRGEEIMEVIEIKDNDFDEERTKVEVTYALLTRENCEQRNKLLLSIIKELSNTKTELVIKLVDYIWSNRDKLNVPQEVFTTIFLNYQHLYETPMVQLATYVVESVNSVLDPEEYHTALNAFHIEEILHVCKSDPELVINIISVLNTLLQLSAFDTHLMVLINVIRKKYLF